MKVENDIMTESIPLPTHTLASPETQHQQTPNQRDSESQCVSSVKQAGGERDGNEIDYIT